MALPPQICILTADGELSERRVRTEPGRFAAVLGDRPRARILLEASTESEWVARCLEASGHEVIGADPNFAPMYATLSFPPRENPLAPLALTLLGGFQARLGVGPGPDPPHQEGKSPALLL